MLDSRFDKIEKELQFRTSRSSGKGGQSVNKLSTKVELIFFVGESSVLTEEEKALINQRLENRIINDGSILISCDEERSQYQNKSIVIERFRQILEEALKPARKRKKTHLPKSVKEKRLKEKKQNADKKNLRRSPEL